MLKLLVTGGAGFIGSNFIHYILGQHQDWQVINLDKLTYAGNLESLKDIENNSRYGFVKGDITDRELIDNLLQDKIDAIINFAAESHVDRSILDASPFIETNVKGTHVLIPNCIETNVFKPMNVAKQKGSICFIGRLTQQKTSLPC